jgi:hypothetical protein
MRDVREFVHQEAAPRFGLRGILAGAERDVLAGGVSAGVQGAGRAVRPRVGVDPHPTKVVAEPWLDGIPRRLIEGLTRR